jgi:hypothetical protein
MGCERNECECNCWLHERASVLRQSEEQPACRRVAEEVTRRTALRSAAHSLCLSFSPPFCLCPLGLTLLPLFSGLCALRLRDPQDGHRFCLPLVRSRVRGTNMTKITSDRCSVAHIRRYSTPSLQAGMQNDGQR